MFNPAYNFTQELLDAFIKKEVHYFVKSTYPRGVSNAVHTAFLISHYHQQAEAERHFNAIAHDRNRMWYHAKKITDLELLKRQTIPVENQCVFSRLIHPDNEKRANAMFRENTRRYLLTNTGWDLTKKVTIFPKFRFQLGELYVRIAHQGDEIIIPFTDIEQS